MSYGGVPRALKSALSHRGPKFSRRGSSARSGASPAAMLGTLGFCAAGGLAVGAVAGGSLLYLRFDRPFAPATAQAASAPSTMPPPMRMPPPMPMPVPIGVDAVGAPGRHASSELHARLDERRERLWEEIDARHAAIRERLEQRVLDPMPRREIPGFRPFAPSISELPTTSPRPPRLFPAGADRPLIPRPFTVSYSRSAPQEARLLLEPQGATRRGWSDPAEARLDRLRSLMHDPAAFSAEASWFIRRRSKLREEIALPIERTIADFVCRPTGHESVTVLPRVLQWYGAEDLPALARLIVRQTEVDGKDSPIECRQTLVGTLQRYRQLDGDWNDPAAVDVVRAMRRSLTVSAHVVRTLESLPQPYSPEMENLLIEFSFDGSAESASAQMTALRFSRSRDRLIREAIARLDSPDETQREAAYMVLAATGPTPAHADAALDAIASGFADERLELSPVAHAALTRWLDAEHAGQFDDFCDCPCPIRRTAARAALGRFGAGANVLATAGTK